MTRNGVHFTTWALGILAALAGALGGALVNYFFGKQTAIEAERRAEVRRAAEDYFAARAGDPKTRDLLGARYRLVFYADSDVLKALAEASRAGARATVDEGGRTALCKSQKIEAHEVVSAEMRVIASVRKQVLQGDPLDTLDMAAIVCPDANAPCFGQMYAAHLFECREAGSK